VRLQFSVVPGGEDLAAEAHVFGGLYGGTDEDNLSQLFGYLNVSKSQPHIFRCRSGINESQKFMQKPTNPNTSFQLDVNAPFWSVDLGYDVTGGACFARVSDGSKTADLLFTVDVPGLSLVSLRQDHMLLALGRAEVGERTFHEFGACLLEVWA